MAAYFATTLQLPSAYRGPVVKAIGYVRVPTEEQVQGIGLAVQREGIAKFCKAEMTKAGR